jgi:hypothetical protein
VIKKTVVCRGTGSKVQGGALGYFDIINFIIFNNLLNQIKKLCKKQN